MIIDLFKSSKLENLRVLKQALLDFSRIIKYIDSNLKKLIEGLLKYAALSNEEFVLGDSNAIKLFPNPTSSQFILSEKVSEVSVFDITGKQVKKFTKNIISYINHTIR